MPDITFEDYHAVPDDAVTEITPEGIRTENGTFIRFADCAANFAALHGGSGRCVGERDATGSNPSIDFYTAPLTTHIIFVPRGLQGHGAAMRRFHALQKQIEAFKAEREFWNVSECHILEDTDAAMVLQYNDPAADKIKIHVYIKKFCQNAVTAYPFCAPGAEYVKEDGTVLSAEQLAEEGLEIPVSTRNTAVEIALTKK